MMHFCQRSPLCHRYQLFSATENLVPVKNVSTNHWRQSYFLFEWSQSVHASTIFNYFGNFRQFSPIKSGLQKQFYGPFLYKLAVF
jgi:hypothetical protein